MSSARTTSRISSIKDLNGKTVGVQAGSALLAAFPNSSTMLEKDGGKLGKIVEYTSYPEAYQDLALGRVDYVVNTIINLQDTGGRKAQGVRDRPGGLRKILPGLGGRQGQQGTARLS